MSVVRIADVKNYLQLTQENDKRDEKLQEVIDSAEAKIGMRIPLDPTVERTSVVYPNGGYLALPVSPVVEIVSVTPNIGDALDVDLLVANGGIVEYATSSATFPAGSYTIVYKAGYTELPKNLRLAIYELVRHLWQPQRGDAKRPGSPPAESQQLGFLMPNRVQELLSDFELPGFA